MNKILTISVCNFFVPEVNEVIKNGDYPDVKLVSFPANCNANPDNQGHFQKIIENAQTKNSDLIILSNTCNSIHYKNEPKTGINIITLKQCFEILINPDTIFHYISNGYYIVSNGWLRSYKQHIQNWGFESETAHQFFNESMKGILFLDTKIPGDYLANLNSLSKYMNLPYEILPIGLTYCKMYIDSLVLSWRNENERKSLNKRISSISRQSADYSMIFNQLELLVNLTDEKKIIDIGFDLINILFAPSKAKYTKYINGSEEVFEFKGITSKNTNAHENSFEFDIYYSNEILGKFNICGIQFSEFMTQYKSMGKIIGQILGISIANARKYQVILNQKDQIEKFSHELQKSNSSKDKLFSIIAHDLKNPFNVLLGYSDLLSEEIENGEMNNIENYFSIINKTLNSTFELLMNLLEWAQTQLNRIEFSPDKLQLLKPVNNNINILLSQANSKNIELVSSIPESIIVFADENMLTTVIRNLISNAIKFTREKGIITISAENNKDEINVCVQDTGIGITAEKINNLFDLETTESSQGTSGEKGTGLGLMLCKEFIEKHRGKIWVESKVGVGSKFIFTLPVKNNYTEKQI